MKTNFSLLLFISSLILACFSCHSKTSGIPVTDHKTFDSYWNQGKAEITSYTLNQSTQTGMHDGKVVLVYVTEDFSQSRLVKLEEPKKHQADVIRVMKLNTTKEYVTGMDKFNMMSSVFSPVEYKDHPHCLKLTSSTQEWGGQTYFQAEWKGHRYETNFFSCFDNETLRDFSLVNTWLEDEMWTKIRISPDLLPVGKIKIVPSTFYLRMNHTTVKVYDAKSTIEQNGFEYIYAIEYPDLKRKLEIHFGKDFPHRILSWKETLGKNEVITATLSKTMMSDYWNHDQPADESLRDSLNLSR